MKKLDSILLIDDDPIINFVNYVVLTRVKASRAIQIEGNGKNALTSLKTQYEHTGSLPQLIFLDLHMPFMNGIDFLKEFNMLFPLTKEYVTIVVMTVGMEKEERNMLEELGVKYFIDKPLSEDAAAELIGNIAAVAVEVH
ncbi:MAG: response regulator [Cytophagaceae bacterium]|nr:response regulator [Cytophagaceae bacterium]